MENEMLRKILLAILVVVLASTAAMAQRPGVELTLEADYLWTSSMDATYTPPGETPRAGTFDIKNSPAFGFAVDIDLRPGTQLEFFYLNQSSQLQFKSVGGPWEDLYDQTMSYYQIGALQGFRRGKAMPFTGVTLGATSINPEAGGTTEWKFSMTFNAGAKVYLSERIALRFHGRALVSFLDTGAGVWFGTGGLSLGITGYGIWQWNLGGGLVILL
jgi:opacity protein-like surface antigen